MWKSTVLSTQNSRVYPIMKMIEMTCRHEEFITQSAPDPEGVLSGGVIV